MINAVFLAQLEAEEADLVRKLVALRAMKEAYGGSPVTGIDEGAVARVRQPRSTQGRGKVRVGLDHFSDYGRETVMRAMRFLLAADRPMQTRRIVEAFEAGGYEIRGENAINALGALLGRSIDILSHGKAGWSLADREKAKVLLGDNAHKENAPPDAEHGIVGGAETAIEGVGAPAIARSHSDWDSEA